MTVTNFGHEQEAIPPGTVIMWQDPDNIPAGWVICDGSNGTPDLLDRFVKCDTTSGEVGGQHTLTLAQEQLPPHTHTGTTSTDGDHTHDYRAYPSGAHTQDVNSWQPWGDGDYTQTTTEDGAHEHTLDVEQTGGGESIDNRPPFYELLFIMRS